MSKINVIIIGAAGRDFHNFNTYYRDNEKYNVVAFTATQIPDIHGRQYPPELAGKLYPNGIPIYEQAELENLIKKHNVDDCVFAFSDIHYVDLKKPVVAVCATRTGTGKSQTSRTVAEYLMKQGLKVVAIRHPMPYGDLAAQKVQRYSTIDDLAKHKCTIEEMEEYEPHIERGNVIYSGVDYQAILNEAENDPEGCDVILWDGGNNDFPFYQPDLMITVADPHRAGHELTYYPGEVNMRIADVIVINKMDSASPEGIETVRNSIRKVNPNAIVVDGASPIRVDNAELIRGKRVLIVEDGPTLTHGDMKLGAGTIAAQKFGAAEIVNPRDKAVGKLKETYEIYPHIGDLLPAMGYSDQQRADLEATIANVDCDSVIIGTPIDLNRIVKIKQPNTRVYYDLQEIGSPNLSEVLSDFVKKHNLK
jgi:predicted GTPase